MDMSLFECFFSLEVTRAELEELPMDHHAHMGHDHAGMDHSAMGHMTHDMSGMGDMSGHDHSAHAMQSGHEGMSMMMHMSMFFHFGYTETILFDFWSISSVAGLIGSMIGIFFMAALYEGLKYYREYLFWKTYNSLQYRSVETPANKTPTTEENTVVHVVGEVIHRQPPSMFSPVHAFQSVLHILQIAISYALMLIFMTYNVWLCLAVALGGGTGYFLFGWKKAVFIDVTEHCH